MVRRSRSRSGTRRGLVSRVYSPISHGLMFGRNTTNTLANTAKGVGRMGFGTVNSIGRSLSGHLNGAIRNLFSRKNRKSRKNRRSASRKNRR